LRRLVIVVGAACALTGASPDLRAQGAASQAEFATISGVALDSIRGGYLRNAVISVRGTDRHTVTDSAGRFRIDSVPPGERGLLIRHVLLDSIGLSVVTRPEKILPGQSISMVVSTPAPATVMSAKCPSTTGHSGRSVIVGTVFDAQTEDPSTGAQVTAEWTELQLKKKSIEAVPQRRSALVSTDGTFRLCDLPADFRSGIKAVRGADTTAATNIDLSSGLAIVALHLPRSSSGAEPLRATTDSPAVSFRPADDRTVVNGRITDVDGRPVGGARVTIEEDHLMAMTAADGTFRIRGAKLGTRTMTIRKLGFEPVRTTIDLKSREPFPVNLTLAKFVAVLEDVTINAVRDRALDRVGFNARRHKGTGTFISPEDLARRNPIRVNDILRVASYLRFTRLPNGTDVVSGRPSIVAGGPGGCVRYFVDGTPWVSTDDSPDSFYHPSEIGAVEIYPPTLVPSQFIRFSQRGELCYVVMLWTKSALQLP
jgi:hypothetical protein